MKLSVKVDSRDLQSGLKRLATELGKVQEDVNNKAVYEVGKIATTTTKTTPKEQIASELMDTRRDTTLAALIVNRDRKAKGKKGLVGEAMKKAVASLIKRRQRTAKFVAAGWIAAVKAIAPFVKRKSSMPVTNTTQKPKSSLGGAYAAKPVAGKASASIWNSVLGGKGKDSKPQRVTQVEMQGLEKAVRIKINDVWKFLDERANQAAKTFNR